MDDSSQAAEHSSAAWPSPDALVLRSPADITTGTIKQPIDVDCANIKIHLKQKILHAPLLWGS